MKLSDFLNNMLYEEEDEKNDKKDKKPEKNDKKPEKKEKPTDDEELTDDRVVVAVKLNDNTKDGGGQIKLLDLKKLNGIYKIEDLISLFNIDFKNIKNVFKDRMELKITSPLKGYKDHLYIIRLMNGVGELYIKVGDKINNTITKYGKGSDKEGEIDLSYMDDLNLEFKQAVKNGMFDKITGEGVV